MTKGPSLEQEVWENIGRNMGYQKQMYSLLNNSYILLHSSQT